MTVFAQWKKPQCGSSPTAAFRQLEIGKYSNRAGVPTVEHPVPKMDSVQLPELRGSTHWHVRVNMAWLAFQPQCSWLPIQLRIRAPGVLGPPVRIGGPFAVRCRRSSCRRWRGTTLQQTVRCAGSGLCETLSRRFPRVSVRNGPGGGWQNARAALSQRARPPRRSNPQTNSDRQYSSDSDVLTWPRQSVGHREIEQGGVRQGESGELRFGWQHPFANTRKGRCIGAAAIREKWFRNKIISSPGAT